MSLLFYNYCYADLTNEGYKAGKAAYQASKWKDALALLEKYKSDDKEFLEANKETSKAVDSAIKYCKSRLSSTLGLVGAKVIWPAPPKLP